MPIGQAYTAPGVRVKRPRRTEQIVLSQSLDPLTGVRMEESLPVKGTISSIVFHFPRGCNALVDVAVGHGERQICPSKTGVIALDEATPVIPVSEKAEEGDTAWAEMANGDGVNSHTITVIITVEGD